MPKRKSAAKPKAPAVEMPAIPVVELGPAAKPTVDPRSPMGHVVEATRSGPPPGPVAPMPKLLGLPPDAADVTPASAPAPVPAPASDDALTDQQIEAKLKDPSFDPSGVERLRLAKLLQRPR